MIKNNINSFISIKYFHFILYFIETGYKGHASYVLVCLYI